MFLRNTKIWYYLSIRINIIYFFLKAKATAIIAECSESFYAYLSFRKRQEKMRIPMNNKNRDEKLKLCEFLPMNFFKNLSFLLLRILVKRSGAMPLKSLMRPNNTKTTALVPVKSILVYLCYLVVHTTVHTVHKVSETFRETFRIWKKIWR